MIEPGDIKVLVGCEFSGAVRDAFLRRGFDAWSCDVLPSEGEYPQRHFQCDLLTLDTGDWDVLIAFPPCTYLCSSGLHWNKRRPERARKTEEALEFVRRLMEFDVSHLSLENPVGCISTRIRRYDQTIQPYEFGHDASKKTCLWLRNLPNLEPTKHVPPRIVNGKPRWANQTDSGQNRLGPGENRARERGRTYQGIAEAMAHQWSSYILSYSNRNINHRRIK